MREIHDANGILALIANVRIAEITSNEPLRTRFPGSDGSYSHIAAEFSMAAIFVTWDIKSTIARLTTWARHLEVNIWSEWKTGIREHACHADTHGRRASAASQSARSRVTASSSTVWQSVSLFEVLSAVTAKSWRKCVSVSMSAWSIARIAPCMFPE